MLDDYGFELFDENQFPQGYLITIRTFGTWLHGDSRESVSRNGGNIYDTPRSPPNERLEKWMIEEMKSHAFLLTKEQRRVVEKSVKDLCDRRGYTLHAQNARTNHAHIVLTAQRKPERIIVDLKANATKFLRAEELVSPTTRVWSRGKSRRYLWKPRNVIAAINYTLYGQGDVPFISEEWEDFDPEGGSDDT
jgi:REP element-mobilizing transposase RayT